MKEYENLEEKNYSVSDFKDGKTGIIEDDDARKKVTITGTFRYRKNAIVTCVNGLLHKEDGPAFVNKKFNVYYWFLHGEQLWFRDFLEKTTASDETKIELVLKYG